ncbi:MAG: VWA domain-containing protein [Bacteroidetes bacterium]|nr:MAG: VWA domain-containing protein [Bacteroidota bacterium]
MLSDFNIIPWEYDYLSPYWLYLLVIIPLFLWFRHRKGSSAEMGLKYAGTEESQLQLGQNWVKYVRWLLSFCYALTGTLLIMAMARPSHVSGYDDYEEKYQNGIDIVLSMDISISMLTRDFVPNRLEAAKKVACEFIDGRKGDRIGLVAYEGEAFTACPATIDHDILKEQINRLEPGMLGDGTAIGIGLGTAVTRLRNDSLPSRVIILLTDGVNNTGDISPIEAARLAEAKKIRVYTIGIGSRGMAPSPVFTPFGIKYQNRPVEIDEMTLTRIAEITGGKYFRATDEKSLRVIYQEIEKLEKRKIKEADYKTEAPVRPLPFLLWASIFLLLSFFIQLFYFRTHGA